MSIPLRFDQLGLVYDAAEGGAVEALRDVSFDVGGGEFVTVIGPSGCGKSSLLNLACGAMRPSAGRVMCGDRPVDGLIREGIGYVFQSDALMPWKSVFENVALALRLQHRPENEVTRVVDGWLERVGLRDFSRHRPQALSGGMRKRVAIAQALVHSPGLLLMDEPFSALDAQTRLLLGNEVLRLWDAMSMTVLFITHDLEEAIALSDRVVVMSARPARVKSIAVIDLPRPRDLLSLRADAHYHDLYMRLWDDLREEVASCHPPIGA